MPIIKNENVNYTEFLKSPKIKIFEQVKELELENEELQRENARLKEQNDIMDQALRHMKNILSDIQTD